VCEFAVAVGVLVLVLLVMGIMRVRGRVTTNRLRKSSAHMFT